MDVEPGNQRVRDQSRLNQANVTSGRELADKGTSARSRNLLSHGDCGNCAHKAFTFSHVSPSPSFSDDYFLRTQRTGATCDAIDTCSSAPCRNGGRCFEQNAFPGYGCECVGAWSGPTCEVPLSACTGACVCVRYACTQTGEFAQPSKLVLEVK